MVVGVVKGRDATHEMQDDLGAQVYEFPSQIGQKVYDLRLENINRRIGNITRWALNFLMKCGYHAATILFDDPACPGSVGAKSHHGHKRASRAFFMALEESTHIKPGEIVGMRNHERPVLEKFPVPEYRAPRS